MAVHKPFDSQEAARLNILLPLALAWIAATDVTLSSLFVFFVYRDKNRVLSGAFRDRLTNMASIAIQACIPTATCAIITLILSRALPTVTIYMAFFVPLGPLYVFSFFFTLNSRIASEASEQSINASSSHNSSSKGRTFRVANIHTLHGTSQITSWNGEESQVESQSISHIPLQVRLAQQDEQSIDKQP
ncbi:hypothetical protein T439DRAFT_351224 [Meredithblackwellia eburnea MCA 4105]